MLATRLIPRYANMLIDVVEKYKLYQYDDGKAPIARRTLQQPTIPDKNLADPEVIYTFRDKPVTLAPGGKDLEAIAADLGLLRFELRKYNDLPKGYVPDKGTLLYLKRKRSKPKEELHTVQEGETMYYISQLYGMRLKKLYKRNRMKAPQQAQAGVQLYLRRRRDATPPLAQSVENQYVGFGTRPKIERSA